MAKYRVTIEETISQDFEIEAESREEAFRLAEAKYKDGSLVVDNGNLIQTMASVDDDGWFYI